MTAIQLEKLNNKWKKMKEDVNNANNYAKSKGTDGYICDGLAKKILDEPYTMFFASINKCAVPINGYFRLNRDVNHRKNNSNRDEDINSARLKRKYPKVVLDTQIPMQDGTKTNADLLLYYKGTLFLGEAKIRETTENILRATLEIERYYRMLHHDVLINEIKNQLKLKVTNKEVKKAILVYELKGKENRLGKKTEYLNDQLTSDNYKNCVTLMKKLHIYAINADTLDKKGQIEFMKGFSPKDY